MNQYPATLDIKTCALILHIKPCTIYRWISLKNTTGKSTIPFMKMNNGRILFKTTDVFNWLATQERR